MLAIERYLRTCESWFTRSSWLFSHTLILVLTHSNLILVDTLVLVHTLLVALAATVELERECHVHEDVANVHALLHLDAWGAREGHAQDHNVMTIMTMTRFNCWTFAFRLRRENKALSRRQALLQTANELLPVGKGKRHPLWTARAIRRRGKQQTRRSKSLIQRSILKCSGRIQSVPARCAARACCRARR